jgi:two-component system, NarL family, response regulator YdfI
LRAAAPERSNSEGRRYGAARCDGAGPGTDETIVIKVLVCAGSIGEMQRLADLVRSAVSLELRGSCLGRAGLAEQIAETRPDVVLERWEADDSPEAEELDPGEWTEANGLGDEAGGVPMVALVGDTEFSGAWAALQGAGSPLRAILPIWASAQEVESAIAAAAQGLVVLHAGVMEAVTAEPAELPAAGVRLRAEGAGQALSPREGEILNLLAAGLGNKEIAWQLKISEHTVKFHVTSIFNKLGASTRAEAVALGMRRGLIVL